MVGGVICLPTQCYSIDIQRFMENGRLSVHWDAQSERSTGMLSHMAVLAVDCSPVIIKNVHLELFEKFVTSNVYVTSKYYTRP